MALTVKKNKGVAKAAVKKAPPTPSKSPSPSKAPSTPKAPSPTPKAEARTGVNIGKTSGKRIMAYQDHTFAINDRPDRRLTDEELAADWCREFPQSRAVQNGRITADMVRAVRRLYNSGTGGHGTPGQENTSHPYVLDGKNRVKSVYRRARKEATEPAAKAVAAEKKGGKKPAKRAA